MALLKDVVSSGNKTNGVATWSWTHNGASSGVVGVLVGVVGENDAITTTSVHWGGTSGSGGTDMTKQGSDVTKSSGEDASLALFFLGSGSLNGSNEVYVTHSGGASAATAFCITVTGAADTEVVDTDTTINGDSEENPSATLSLGGDDCFCAQFCFSGRPGVADVTPLTDWTSDVERYVSQVAFVYTYDIIGSTDVTMGWTQTSDDAVAIGVAIKESAAASGSVAGINTGLIG